MRIEKKKLADLHMGYAIAGMKTEGKEYCICASEEREGKCLLMDPETGECHVLWDGPGGVMAVLPVPGEQAFLTIEKFFPVFDSAAAEIYRVELWFDDGKPQIRKTRLCGLPYVHRIALMNCEGKLMLIGAALCEKKESVDDWSHPGSVYAGEYHGNEPVELTKIYDGLTKNHGLYIREMSDGKEELLIGASEGIVRITYEKGWNTQLLAAGETSDIAMSDFDGDGEEEMAVIQGFHGNRLRVLKAVEEGRFDVLKEYPLEFGHVAWAGTFAGKACMIGGSRSGRKELTLYMAETGPELTFTDTVIDEQIGPAQIFVKQCDEKMVIYSASHGTDEVTMYMLSQKG